MMIDLRQIRSVSDFQRNAKAHIRRLKKTGKPEVLTVNGKAELVVQSAESYQRMLDEMDRTHTRETLRRRLDPAKKRLARPMRQALEELGKSHGIELK